MNLSSRSLKTTATKTLTEDKQIDGLSLLLAFDCGRTRVVAFVFSHDLGDVKLLYRRTSYFHISPARRRQNKRIESVEDDRIKFLIDTYINNSNNEVYSQSCRHNDNGQT